MSQQFKLARYDKARSALAACVSVDEVKDWADRAAAMQAYGRMANDRSLQVDAAEIRLRAERRLGEMLVAAKAAGQLASGARIAGARPGANDGSSAVVTADHRPTLAEAGISKDLSARAQKLAAVPDAEFEAELAAKRERDLQDGARVSARLEAAGARELERRAAQQQPEDVTDAVIEPRTILEQASMYGHELDRIGALVGEPSRMRVAAAVEKALRHGGRRAA